MKDEMKKWWNELFEKAVQVYPRNSKCMWKSPQCDGCFEIMLPDENVIEWQNKHFPHRYEAIKHLLEPPKPNARFESYDFDSMHIRKEVIETKFKELQ